jgi:hypothetical protein
MKVMRPTLHDLHDEKKFNKIEDFHIDETMKFLMNLDWFGKELETNIDSKKKTKNTILFFAVSALIGAFGGKFLINKDLNGLYFIITFALFFVVILPIHKTIHAILFKSFKAADVGFGIAPKAGMVYAYAQDFPISMKELIKVAIMPFAIITPILIGCIFLLPQYQTAIVAILLIHTLACIGDFALVKYGYKNKDKEIYTYDDIKNEKRTYYFEKR